MKNFKIFFLLIILFSCTGKTEINESYNKNTNFLVMEFLGHWESFRGEYYEKVNWNKTKYNEIEKVDPITLNKKKVKQFVYFSNENNHFIIIEINELNNELLLFQFTVNRVTYYPDSNFKFEFSINNNTLSASFSGYLDHWNNATKKLQITKIKKGSLNFKF